MGRRHASKQCRLKADTYSHLESLLLIIMWRKLRDEQLFDFWWLGVIHFPDSLSQTSVLHWQLSITINNYFYCQERWKWLLYTIFTTCQSRHVQVRYQQARLLPIAPSSGIKEIFLMVYRKWKPVTEVCGFNLISRVLSASSPGVSEMEWGVRRGASEGTNLRTRLLAF